MHCHASAHTFLINGQHYLRYMGEDNHTSDSSRKYIIVIFENLKWNARQINDRPAEIIEIEIRDIQAQLFKL